MILVSFLPLWCALMSALDYMFVGAVGEVFVIIISTFLMCTWCCTFFIVTNEVEQQCGFDNNDEEAQPEPDLRGERHAAEQRDYARREPTSQIDRDAELARQLQLEQEQSGYPQNQRQNPRAGGDRGEPRGDLAVPGRTSGGARL